MLYLRKTHDRGTSQNNWLTSFHTFSFADYHDTKFMGFGNLRVINEDTVQPGRGFRRHAHSDMEIISYVIQGSLEHQDSLGNKSVIQPGEIQIMTAGTGVEHAEFNHSKTDLLHFLQIWILPQKTGLKPLYQQKPIQKSHNAFTLIGSPDKKEDAVTIHQDVHLFSAYLDKDYSIEYAFNETRIGWVQLIKGKIELNGQVLIPGDGASIQNEKILNFYCIEDSELLFFDLGIKIK